jgi:hypothetical protein
MNKLNLSYVSDIIGESYKDWKPGNIILLDAQTGTGKNFFIENVLIPWIGDKKLLFISNRTNLKRQVKKRLLEEYVLKVPETLEELDEITTIKNITISSYHSLQQSAKDELYKGDKFDLSYFDYLVMDECHFILSDSGFNNLNRLSYEKLVTKQYINIVKIFMSATMDEIKGPIIRCAEKGIGLKPKIHEYSTGKDYSYVNVKYLKHKKYTEKISNMILNDATDNKWLIFVSVLKDGESILETIGKEKGSIIQAGTKDNKELDSIINDSCFKKKVLITTKALDNGINIKDELLKNIVILTWDKTTFVQMLGRKRIVITDAQEINLYISMRYPKSFMGLLKSYDAKQKGIDLLFLEGDNKNQFNKKYDNNFKKLVLLGDVVYKSHFTNEFKYNPVGGTRLFKDRSFANEMIEQFKYDDYAYVKEQLKWLELSDTFDKENTIEDVILNSDIESLEQYLESIVGIDMMMVADRKELIAKIHLIDTHHSNAKKGKIKLLKNINTLNSYFLEKEIDFYIKQFEAKKVIDGKIKNYKSVWKVMRLSDLSNNPDL